MKTKFVLNIILLFSANLYSVFGDIEIPIYDDYDDNRTKHLRNEFEQRELKAQRLLNSETYEVRFCSYLLDRATQLMEQSAARPVVVRQLADLLKTDDQKNQHKSDK